MKLFSSGICQMSSSHIVGKDVSDIPAVTKPTTIAVTTATKATFLTSTNLSSSKGLGLFASLLKLV